MKKMGNSLIGHMYTSYTVRMFVVMTGTKIKLFQTVSCGTDVSLLTREPIYQLYYPNTNSDRL